MFFPTSTITINVPRDSFPDFKDRLMAINKGAMFPDLSDAYHISTSDDGAASIAFESSFDNIIEVTHALAWTDTSLLSEIRDQIPDTVGKNVISWTDHMIESGESCSWREFDDALRAKRYEQGRAALELVENGETDNGYWVRATSAEAGFLATDISMTGVGSSIESTFSMKDLSEDGRIAPEYYLLVDSPDNPSRAHVALAAFKSDDISDPAADVSKMKTVAPHGHATGFNNRNPYPEFEKDIEKLVEVEGLHYTPNHVGRALDPADFRAESRYESPGSDGPGM